MKKNLLVVFIISWTFCAVSQTDGLRTSLDTIPITPIEFQIHDSLTIRTSNIIGAFKLGEDSVLIYKQNGLGIQLIFFRNELIEVADVGISQYDAIKMNLYSDAKDLKYTAFIDSLGTMNPFLILKWQSIGVWTSSLCFGDSGDITNKSTKVQNGITVIDIKNSTVVFNGLTGFSTSNSNINEGGFGGNCSSVSIDFDRNILSLKHISSPSKSELIDLKRIVGYYQCPENNLLYFYRYEISENADYKLNNGMFVKLK